MSGAVMLKRTGLWLLAALVCSGCDGPDDDTTQDGIGLLSLPATTGFERADRPREFEFPADHGKHPGFRSEWWYVTGNVQADDDQRRFGYQVTFFRFLADPSEDADGQWEADAVWLAHAALTDVSSGEFLTSEQLSRELTGVTGAADAMLDVHTNGWRLVQPGPDAPYELSVSAGDFNLQLSLQPGKPTVLQGENGLSRKSAADPLNASYYYSQTRLATAGSVQVAGRSYPVSGTSWFDREWSTSALNARQTGWDWFALQLDNEHELMFYRLRLDDGSADAASAGVWVDPDGRVTRLAVTDVTLEPLRFWRSPAGARYPVAWNVTSERLGINFRVSAVLPDQLWQGWVSYWEGAVDVSGDYAGQDVQGRGYVELTGY